MELRTKQQQEQLQLQHQYQHQHQHQHQQQQTSNSNNMATLTMTTNPTTPLLPPLSFLTRGPPSPVYHSTSTPSPPPPSLPQAATLSTSSEGFLLPQLGGLSLNSGQTNTNQPLFAFSALSTPPNRISATHSNSSGSLQLPMPNTLFPSPFQLHSLGLPSPQSLSPPHRSFMLSHSPNSSPPPSSFSPTSPPSAIASSSFFPPTARASASAPVLSTSAPSNTSTPSPSPRFQASASASFSLSDQRPPSGSGARVAAGASISFQSQRHQQSQSPTQSQPQQSESTRPSTASNKREWSEATTNELLLYVQRFGEQWDVVATLLSEKRSPTECKVRYESFMASQRNSKDKNSRSFEDSAFPLVKKRYRRTASEIDRGFVCEEEGCHKSYGTEGALKMHIKLKHANSAQHKLPVRERAKPSKSSPSVGAPGQSARACASMPVVSSSSPGAAAAASPSSGMWIDSLDSNRFPSITGGTPTKAVQIPGGSKLFSSSPPSQSWLGGGGMTANSNMHPIRQLGVGGWRKTSSISGDFVARCTNEERCFFWDLIVSGNIIRIIIPFDHVNKILVEHTDLQVNITIDLQRPARLTISSSNSPFGSSMDSTLALESEIKTANRHELSFDSATFADFHNELMQDKHLRNVINVTKPSSTASNLFSTSGTLFSVGANNSPSPSPSPKSPTKSSNSIFPTSRDDVSPPTLPSLSSSLLLPRIAASPPPKATPSSSFSAPHGIQLLNSPSQESNSSSLLQFPTLSGFTPKLPVPSPFGSGSPGTLLPALPLPADMGPMKAAPSISFPPLLSSVSPFGNSTLTAGEGQPPRLLPDIRSLPPFEDQKMNERR